ncbi:MAG: GntR family transcriptional regulator [Acidimicrobiales bacterium]
MSDQDHQRDQERGPKPLDRSDPVPLWAQVLSDLRRRLGAGEFADRFPTDRELVEEYGVSRQTVREAVRRLDAEGVLERSRGRGTSVRAPEFEQPVGGHYSLFRSIEDQGVEQASEVRALDVRPCPEAAAHLDLAPDAPLVHVERLRRAGGAPLALDRAWLPDDVAHPLLEADFRHTGLYDELAGRCGIQPGWVRERIRPVVPSPDERRVLHLGRGDAGFAVDRLTRATGGRLVEWRQSLVRGDRYAFVAEWPVQGSPAARARRGLRLA